MTKNPNVGTKDISKNATTSLMYIVIEINYRHKLVLSMEDGLNYIKGYAQGLHLEHEYKSDKKLISEIPPLTINFISEQEIKELKLTQMLEKE